MKTRVAERLLSSVLPPDHAASTVGDLLEGAAQRGNIWFWSAILHTWLARIRRNIAAAPFRMLALALRGFLFLPIIDVFAFRLVMSPLAEAIVSASGILGGFWHRRRQAMRSPLQ